MSLLKRIEKSMDQRLRSIFAGGGDDPGAREGIELHRDAMDRIAARVTVGKRGERLFPFNLITIELAAENAERKAVLETVFDPGQITGDIRATLKEEHAAPPDDLTVMVRFPDGAATDLNVICEKTEKPEPVPAAVLVFQLKPARLTTLAGAASAPEFEAAVPRVNIGRENEVLDSLGRPIRRNELFFPEEADEANASVSRAHAHLGFDTSTGVWRIYDDGSSLGTSLFRDGKRIEVPGHASRGVSLRAGDEIYLGQVRLKFEQSG